MATIYRAWLFLQEHVVGTVAALTLVAVTVFAVSEMLTRYVAGHTFEWGQDAVTYLVVSATFLYFGASQAKRAHLAVTALPDWLRSGGRIRAAVAIRAFALLCVVLFVAGFVYWGLPAAARTFRVGTVTESLALPMWPFQYALVVGITMMGVTALFQLYRDVMRLFGRDVFPWESDDDRLEL
ncbi:MAG TPA: TRAP transporter small permease [Geminicoccaceae bacterium]|nr:TRAP transporter small permease [Geminicoccaceae bacterium]